MSVIRLSLVPIVKGVDHRASAAADEPCPLIDKIVLCIGSVKPGGGLFYPCRLFAEPFPAADPDILSHALTRDAGY